MKIRLWTIQPLTVWEQLKKNGIFHCDANLAMCMKECEFESAYQWMAKQMRRRIGEPPAGVVYPIWAWHTLEWQHKKSDLRRREFRGYMGSDRPIYSGDILGTQFGSGAGRPVLWKIGSVCFSNNRKREVKRMAKYSDEEIRAMPKITVKIAADYLGISPNMLTLGMRNNLLPIGFTVHNQDRYRDSWSYTIVPERLIAYNHGKVNEVQVENIEKNLNTIIHQFEEMKRDLVFLLSEKEE